MSDSGGRGGVTTGAMAVFPHDHTKTTATRPGLIVLYAPPGHGLPSAYPLDDRPVTLGREAPADIVLPLAAVSRSHASVHRDAHGWVLRDLGARNGTLVNGRFVREHRLAHGDTVRLGDVFFKFVSHDADGYRAYGLDGTVAAGAPSCPPGLVGGHQMATQCQLLQRIAHSSMTVLLFGESGTGKEVFARHVHGWSGRRGRFCAINCAAIPANLLESELFGYRRGAFSGADRDHVGLVRSADGGTLFLDEIGDMPPSAQAKLLRVLQTKEVTPLGATRPEPVDLRVVAATHRDLWAMQRAGTFRGDLFARLNEYSTTLPPLRDRREDIHALCRSFLSAQGRPDLGMTVAYMAALLHYPFPYNVRELEALIKRGVALVDGPALDAAQLSAEISHAMASYGRHDSLPPNTAPAAMPAPTAMPAMPAHAAMAPPPTPPIQPPPPTPFTPPATTPTAPAASPTAKPPATSPFGFPAMGNPAGNRNPAGNPRAGANALSATLPSGVPPLAPRNTRPTEAELRAVLAQTGGNVAAVGRHYGKERMQVHRWMKHYQIDVSEYRS